MPSKKVLTFALACIVALGSIIFAYFYSPKNKRSASTIPVVTVASQTAQIQSQFNETDSDHDGLKDWEETLWGTDAHKSDTDGDGTSDGDEVKQGRNPLVKGPNDKLSSKDIPIALQAKIGSSSSQMTETQKAAQELFTRYMALKQSGQNITPETEQQLVQQLLAQHKTVNISIPVYTVKDIKVASSESQDSIKAYGNIMGAILVKDSPKVDVAELTILGMAVDNNDPSQLKKIAIMVEAYKKMQKDIQGVSVPPSATMLHIEILNDLSEVIYADTELQKFFTDPLKALDGLQAYKQAGLDTQNTFASIADYFTANEIQYSSTDAGFHFVHGMD